MAFALPYMQRLRNLTLNGYDANGVALAHGLARSQVKLLQLRFASDHTMSPLVWPLLWRLPSVSMLVLGEVRSRYSKLASLFQEMKPGGSLQVLIIESLFLVDRQDRCQLICCSSARSFWRKPFYGLKPHPQLMHMQVQIHGQPGPKQHAPRSALLRHRFWCSVSVLIAFMRANRGAALRNSVISLIKHCMLEWDIWVLPCIKL